MISLKVERSVNSLKNGKDIIAQVVDRVGSESKAPIHDYEIETIDLEPVYTMDGKMTRFNMSATVIIYE